jgi:hypothetical protein
MAAGATPVRLSTDTAASVLEYSRKTHTLLHNTWSIRPRLEEIDKEYMMEGDLSEEDRKARQAIRAGDKTRYRNITIPVIMPQCQAAAGYLNQVFLSGNPIFPVHASPSYEDAAIQIEAIMSENSKSAKWVRELILFFLDGMKYNLHALEVSWAQRPVATLETDPTYKGGKEGKPKTTIWQGNTIKRMDMYNTIFDPRVAPCELYRSGEFAGYIELCSRVELKRYINSLFGQVPADTAIKAFESGGETAGMTSASSYAHYYLPQINPTALLDRNPLQSFDWLSWATNDPRQQRIRYKNMYQKFILYARILPNDFGLRVPEENTPQVWKFVIINNSVVLYAERLTNAHDYIPILFGQPLEDGLQFQTKSFAQNAQPFQQYQTALWNASTASKRRAVMDRGLYDPSRVSETVINSPNPSAKMPVRPAAYGKPLAEAYFPIPYKDEVSAAFHQEAELVNKFADRVNGQNPPYQGSFIKGNRTKHEYEDVMGHANWRNQTIALLQEHQVFSTVKEILLLNVLQFQDEKTIYSPSKKMHIKVDPLILRQAAIEFQVADGLTPSDKLMNVDAWQVFFQILGTSPAIQQEYDMGDFVSYLMKLQGADVREFQKPKDLVLFQQQMAAWQNAAAMAAQKGTPFSTPMPAMPPSIIAELQKKQAMDEGNKPTANLQQMIAAAAAAGAGTTPQAKGGNGSLPQTAPTPEVGATGVPNA